MNIDQRLHRAAHELRELDVQVPPLQVGSSRRRISLRRLGAPVATAMLFALGAVATAGDWMPATTADDSVPSDVAVDDVDEPEFRTEESATTRQLSPLEELAMITSLRPPEPASTTSTDRDPSIPPGAS